ncbi:MAG: acyl carrier protein [Clostridia bacterium]|nr:acyl carrier protein [Clostridia bacterium]
MERLYEILEDIQPDVDYATCDKLIDAHILDSLALLSLVSELEEEYDITIPTIEINQNNFNSAKKIMDLILRLKEDY